MSVKPIVLLIIFLLNMTALAFADSSHIEVEIHDDVVSHVQDHHDHSSETKQTEEHCEDHEECHNGHFHHYLISTNSQLITINNSDAVFTEYHSFYNFNFLEIIKPPLLNS